jgi:hypothetical protein
MTVIAPLSGARGTLVELPNGRWLYRSRRVVDGRKLAVGYTGRTAVEAVRAFDHAVWAGQAGTFSSAWRRATKVRFLPIARPLASDRAAGTGRSSRTVTRR